MEQVIFARRQCDFGPLGIDQNALDEMKDKMSTAAGEAMLVRIEMERFEATVNERTDHLSVRITEVETSLQDATMDVSTAVQLDRLENIERALAELDPDQFVRKDGRDAPESATAPASMYDSEGGVAESEAVSPDLFVMQDPSGGRHDDAPHPPPAPPSSGGVAPQASADDDGGEPDLPGGIDIGAIIAAAEAAHDHEK